MSQTSFTIDTPYCGTAPLPPIFNSKLCIQTKPVYLSKSCPDLRMIVWVTMIEEDLFQEAAEEALNDLYDH